MRPYSHKKLQDYPDKSDISAEGRPSREGRLKSRKRRETRRILKRQDKARTNREVFREDN